MFAILKELPGPWQLSHPDDLQMQSMRGLFAYKTAPLPLCKDIIFAVLCTIVFPIGLVYVCVCAIYCKRNSFPLALAVFPFTREAVYQNRLIRLKKIELPEQNSKPQSQSMPEIESTSESIRKSESGQDPYPPELPKAVRVGIPNIGNTCYMNVVLQILYQCQLFVDAVNTGVVIFPDDQVFSSLSALFKCLADGRDPGECAHSLMDALKKSGTWIHRGHHDSWEFFLYLADYVRTRYYNVPTDSIKLLVDDADAAGKLPSCGRATLSTIGFYSCDPKREIHGDVANFYDINLGF
ncbi:MAG: ubiquitin carboxyl-terminal hydrolase, partial [Puniceicoccales bacterium]|nr:ubiquitin carboxyl-terminal hydrolase [Puniceicoccales bacterium]